MLLIIAKYLPTSRQSYDRVIYHLNFYHSSKSSLAYILHEAPHFLGLYEKNFEILWTFYCGHI